MFSPFNPLRAVDSCEEDKMRAILTVLFLPFLVVGMVLVFVGLVLAFPFAMTIGTEKIFNLRKDGW